MSRLVRINESQPLKVEDKWICQCGLSATAPFCDGTHKQIPDDEDGNDVYERHDGELKRSR